MLTGDKRETAENIGFACNLLRDEMTRIYLLDGDIKELHKLCRQKLQAHKLQSNPKVPREDLALLVDGKALLELTRCMDEDAEVSPAAKEAMMDFLALATNCKAVICCRVSPDQKRQVVALVAKFVSPTPMTVHAHGPRHRQGTVRARDARVHAHTQTRPPTGWSRHQWQRRHASCAVSGLCNRAVSVSEKTDLGARPRQLQTRLAGRVVFVFLCVCVCVCVCVYVCMHAWIHA